MAVFNLGWFWPAGVTLFIGQMQEETSSGWGQGCCWASNKTPPVLVGTFSTLRSPIACCSLCSATGIQVNPLEGSNYSRLETQKHILFCSRQVLHSECPSQEPILTFISWSWWPCFCGEGLVRRPYFSGESQKSEDTDPILVKLDKASEKDAHGD